MPNMMDVDRRRCRVATAGGDSRTVGGGVTGIMPKKTFEAGPHNILLGVGLIGCSES
jgi:hypothetical protein